MTFEGDAVGSRVADTILSSGAANRRVLVDDYTRVNINDTSLASAAARADAALQSEVGATGRMFRNLSDRGVPVRLTNPIGRLGLNYPCRNHKKLIVADGVAYIGGMNFSEHNFAWPDLMLRIDDADVADFLAHDFDNTFGGEAEASSIVSGRLRVRSLDGRTNKAGFAELFGHIAAARREIVVASPYLSTPFVDALGAAADRGVTVRLLTPWANNKPIVRDALLWAASRHGFEVVLGPVMSHLKGMLIDGERLILGSSNFDFASFSAEEEFLAITDDPVVVRDFATRVISPAIASALPALSTIGQLKGRAADLALRVAALGASAVKGFPRTAVDWPGPAWNSGRTITLESEHT